MVHIPYDFNPYLSTKVFLTAMKFHGPYGFNSLALNQSKLTSINMTFDFKYLESHKLYVRGISGLVWLS